MSQNITQDNDEDFDLEDYRSDEGMESKTANVSSDSHPLKEKLGASDSDKERSLDVSIGAKRLIDLYESPDAGIRELLSNAESACLDRARIELREAGVDVPTQTTELLEKAKNVVGYEPQIDVTHRKKPEATTLSVIDNGCGISSNRYRVIQNIGYSTSKDESTQLGQFGVGYYAPIRLVGEDNFFQMTTKSVKTDESYSTLEYLVNVEYMDEERDSYGTEFHFPNFCQAAKNIDVRSAVEEYSQGLRATVVYREFDESGEETDHSEEYQPTALEDRCDDDSLTVVYEDDFVKAVMSPESKPSYETLNISMPIQRNVDYGYSDTAKFDAKWEHDVRVKREDGAICATVDDDLNEDHLVGRVPIEDTKFDKKQADALDGLVGAHMVTDSVGDVVDSGPYAGREVIGRDDFRTMKSEARDEYIPLSRVPDGAVSMPKPSSSRDGYEKGNDDFWRYVSKQLMESWKDIAADRFADLNDWQSFLDMSDEEQEALVRAYNQFGPSYGTNEPSNIQDELEDQFGETIPEDTCKKLDNLNKSYLVVEEGCDRPDLKGNTSSTNIRKILRNYDEVYMAKTVSKKKAELVWGLPEDTAIVRLDGEFYSVIEDLWGWNKLKTIPSRNVREKMPRVDDDVLDEWADKTVDTTSSSNSGGGGGKKGLDSKTITVRTSRRLCRYMNKIRVSTLIDKLENKQSFSTGSFSKSCEWLIVKKQTEISGSTPPTSDCSRNTAGGIAATAVPNYVYEALTDTPRAFGSFAQVRHAIEQENIEAIDTAENVLFASSKKVRYFGGEDALVEAINEWTDYSLDVDSTDVHTSWDATFIDAADISADTYKVGRNTSLADERISLPMDEIRASEHLPDCIDDYHSNEFYTYFGGDIKSLNFDSDEFEVRKQVVIEAGGIPALD
jgi:hypothetical protein